MAFRRWSKRHVWATTCDGRRQDTVSRAQVVRVSKTISCFSNRIIYYILSTTTFFVVIRTCQTNFAEVLDPYLFRDFRINIFLGLSIIYLDIELEEICRLQFMMLVYLTKDYHVVFPKPVPSPCLPVCRFPYSSSCCFFLSCINKE